MAEKNIIMQRKTATGYDKYYPKTKAGLVEFADGTTVEAHKADYANPHKVTKSQVGLGEVQNCGIATKTESENGTTNDKYMTPLRTKEAVAASIKKSYFEGSKSMQSEEYYTFTIPMGKTPTSYVEIMLYPVSGGSYNDYGAGEIRILSNDLENYKVSYGIVKSDGSGTEDGTFEGVFGASFSGLPARVFGWGSLSSISLSNGDLMLKFRMGYISSGSRTIKFRGEMEVL